MQDARCSTPTIRRSILRLLAFWLVFAVSPVGAGPVATQPVGQALLDASGISQILTRSDVLISREVANLAKAPLGFSAAELASLQQELLDQSGPESLQAVIVARLQQELDDPQQQRLLALFRSAQGRVLQELQASLDDPATFQGLRSYRVHLDEQPPNPHRIGLIRQLDSRLQHSLLETGLRVELRKQLLAMASQMKTRDTYSEALLDDQLASFRRDLQAQLSHNAVTTHLYLLKHTASADLQALVDLYADPAYQRFMVLCRDALQDSFRAARLQLRQDLRVAKQ